MFHPISRPFHGVLDYLYAASIAATPELLGFADDAPKATLACRVLGAGTLSVSLLTRYELGLIRLLPFKLHLLGDVLTGLTALALPLGLSVKNERGRAALFGFGALALVVAALTQPENMD